MRRWRRVIQLLHHHRTLQRNRWLIHGGKRVETWWLLRRRRGREGLGRNLVGILQQLRRGTEGRARIPVGSKSTKRYKSRLLLLVAPNFDKVAYHNSKLLSQLGSDKAKYESSHSNACPESCSHHSRSESFSCTFTNHERHDPASQSYFHANVAKEKD